MFGRLSKGDLNSISAITMTLGVSLMKGDEVVELREETTDFILLGAIWQHQFHLGKLLAGNLKKR